MRLAQLTAFYQVLYHSVRRPFRRRTAPCGLLADAPLSPRSAASSSLRCSRHSPPPSLLTHMRRCTHMPLHRRCCVSVCRPCSRPAGQQLMRDGEDSLGAGSILARLVQCARRQRGGLGPSRRCDGSRSTAARSAAGKPCRRTTPTSTTSSRSGPHGGRASSSRAISRTHARSPSFSTRPSQIVTEELAERWEPDQCAHWPAVKASWVVEEVAKTVRSHPMPARAHTRALAPALIQALALIHALAHALTHAPTPCAHPPVADVVLDAGRHDAGGDARARPWARRAPRGACLSSDRGDHVRVCDPQRADAAPHRVVHGPQLPLAPRPPHAPPGDPGLGQPLGRPRRRGPGAAHAVAVRRANPGKCPRQQGTAHRCCSGPSRLRRLFRCLTRSLRLPLRSRKPRSRWRRTTSGTTTARASSPTATAWTASSATSSARVRRPSSPFKR